MKKNYIRSISLLVTTTIVCLIIYFLTSCYKMDVLATIFGNMSVGLITGFVILLITNLKNSLIYQNNLKINELRSIIDKSREYEIKILNFKGKKEVPVIELIYIYADLANLFTDINNYDTAYYDKNSLNCKEIVNECNDIVGKLSDIMHIVNIDNKKYEKDFDSDLSSKMVKIFKLRRDIQSDLKNIEKETESLYKSIL